MDGGGSVFREGRSSPPSALGAGTLVVPSRNNRRRAKGLAELLRRIFRIFGDFRLLSLATPMLRWLMRCWGRVGECIHDGDVRCRVEHLRPVSVLPEARSSAAGLPSREFRRPLRGIEPHVALAKGRPLLVDHYYLGYVGVSSIKQDSPRAAGLIGCVQRVHGSSARLCTYA